MTRGCGAPITFQHSRVGAASGIPSARRSVSILPDDDACRRATAKARVLVPQKRITARSASPMKSALDRDPTAVHVTAEAALESLRQSGSIRKAAKVFFDLDNDKDGKLLPQELQAALATQKLLVSNKEINRLIQMVDDDGDGLVEIDEFLLHCHSSIGTKLSRAAALSEPPINVSSDGNTRGRLQSAGVQEELKTVLEQYPQLLEALPIHKPKVRMLFEALDRDQDAFISTDELSSYLRRKLLSSVPPDHVPAEALEATRAGRIAAGFGTTVDVHVSGGADASRHALDAKLPFDSMVARLVSLADTNGDGHVECDDLSALVDALSRSSATADFSHPLALAESHARAITSPMRGRRASHPHPPLLRESLPGGSSELFVPSGEDSSSPAHTSETSRGAVGSTGRGAPFLPGSGLSSPRSPASSLLTTDVPVALRDSRAHVAAMPVGYHNTRHGTSIPLGGGVSSSTHLRAAVPVPYWKQQTEGILVPASDGPSFATSADRFHTTARDAAVAG